MSITTRLWSKKDLAEIKAGTADKHLITIFLNGVTFLGEEIKAYPYNLRKEYVAGIDQTEEYVHFYATDDESARWFIEETYDPEAVYSIEEVITTYRSIYQRTFEGAPA